MTIPESTRTAILRRVGKRPNGRICRASFALWFAYALTLVSALRALRAVQGKRYRGSVPHGDDSVDTLRRMVTTYENRLAGLRSDGETLAGDRHSNVGLLPKSVREPLSAEGAVSYVVGLARSGRPQVRRAKDADAS